MRRLATWTVGRVLLSFGLLAPAAGGQARAEDDGESWSDPRQQVAWWKNLYALFPTDHVEPDFTGLAKDRFRPPPAPYTHPRVYFNPEDVPDIRRRLRETEMGRAAIGVIREFVARSLADNEVYDGLAAGRTDRPFEDKLRDARWSLSIAMLYQGFLCLIDDDREAAEKLARALTELARRADAELAHKPTSADGDWLRGLPPEIQEVIPTGQDWRTEVQGIVAHNNLALCYDFVYPWMNDAQRAVVRQMIANSCRDTWSHGMGVPGLNQGNWQPFHWRAGIQALTIEGEDGYDPKVVASTVRQMTQYYTYFFTRAGAPLEGLGKGSLGTCYLPAFAKRGHWLIAYPGLRKAVGEFLLHSLQPWGGQFHTYGGLGGATGSVSAARNLLALKYAFPDDPAVDFLFRHATGEQYETIRDGNINGHYAQMYFYLYYAIFAQDHSDTDRPRALAALAPPLTWFCGERAQLMTRSQWSPDALYLHFHVRQLQSSHVRDESGMFSLSALGRVWALYPAVHHRGPFGEAREARHHNVVTIDDACTGSNPGHMIDFADAPLATFATGDHRPAWDWVSATGEPQPEWVEDTSTPNDRISMASAKRSEPGFDVPWSAHSHWLSVGRKAGRRWKRPHYPVRHAFRSAGLVRGLHPYAMVVDDVRKDDAVHDYKWLMQLPHDLDVLCWEWEDSTTGFRADVILHERPANGTDSDRRLLVRVLHSAVEQPDVAINLRTNKPITPGYVETYPAYGSTQRGRRLVIPSRSIEPQFKVLLFPYRKGEELPATAWYRDGKKLVVQWHDQRDVFLFDAGEDGRTRFTLNRVEGPLAETPFALGRPVDEVARPRARLIGHWTFDKPAAIGEGAPTEVPDASGGNHPGKIVGGELVPGVQGRCLRLAGNGRMELPPHLLALATQGISVSVWMRPARTDVPNSRLLSTGVHLREGFDLNGYAGGVRASGLGDYWLGFTGRKLSRKWRHIVATCVPQQGLATFYVNGQLVAEKEIAGPLRLGRAPHLIVADGFEGEIDELRLYDGLLDDRLVASLYRREGRYEIGHWPFDRLEDGWRLSSDAGYDAVADQVKLTSERFGQAAVFDGLGRITLPKEVITEHFRGAVSVSLWFHTDAETIAGNSHLFDANEHLRNGLWIDFYGRGIRMNAAGGYGRCFSRDVKPDVWNHLVVTYDGTTAGMYLDGRRVAESRFFGDFTLGRELTLGGTGYRGQIDDVRLYTYPLSEAEVQRIFQSEAAD